jgi:alkanesulfonate monooxygenase SsuD/methylene tetrahydromethanopterin reductase-like flavin-dependent oxidoreductase (luciferase family)
VTDLTTSRLRVGVCLLPEQRWAQDAARWRDADAAGFATLWTYDHLSWRTLRDGPWFAGVPLLSAAAAVTSRSRLGFLVATPNFRHPVPFAKDVMTLDEVSGGRVDLGLGAGGTGADAAVLGIPPLPAAERTGRFEEFVDLLDQLLRSPATTSAGRWFSADDARMIPGCVQTPRVPFTIAATGPRGLRLAARLATTWVTYGPAHGDDDAASWWEGVRRQRDGLDSACRAGGRDPADVRRMALVSLEASWQQDSPDAWDDFTGRLAEERFTDVVVHWPRSSDDGLPGPSRATFDHVVASLPGTAADQ